MPLFLQVTVYERSRRVQPTTQTTQKPLLSDCGSCAALVLWFHLSRRRRSKRFWGGCDNVNRLRLWSLSLSIAKNIPSPLFSIDHRNFEEKWSARHRALQRYSADRVDISVKWNNGPNVLHWPGQPVRPVSPFPLPLPPYPHCTFHDFAPTACKVICN